MANEKTRNWQFELAAATSKLNSILEEAAKEGIFPAIRVHRNDELFGFGVQVVEASCVLGIMSSSPPPKDSLVA